MQLINIRLKIAQINSMSTKERHLGDPTGSNSVD